MIVSNCPYRLTKCVTEDKGQSPQLTKFNMDVQDVLETELVSSREVKGVCRSSVE